MPRLPPGSAAARKQKALAARARVQVLSKEFKHAHRIGMDALRGGDGEALGEAIRVEGAIIDELAGVIEEQGATIKAQREVLLPAAPAPVVKANVARNVKTAKKTKARKKAKTAKRR